MSKIFTQIKQNSFYLVLLAGGLTVLSISGFLYYNSTIYNAADYDMEIIGQRNTIVRQVDELTNCLTANTEQSDCEQLIKKLETENNNLSTLIDKTEVPKGREDLKKSNTEFMDKSKSVAENGNLYLDTFENNQQDVQAIISNYNQSVDSLNEQVIAINSLTKK
jgi:predicted RNase H-like nuclease (RuvC/YqgF family)